MCATRIFLHEGLLSTLIIYFLEKQESRKPTLILAILILVIPFLSITRLKEICGIIE